MMSSKTARARDVKAGLQEMLNEVLERFEALYNDWDMHMALQQEAASPSYAAPG